MSIMLGNLTTKQIEDRLGIALTDTEREALNSMHQSKAEGIQKDKWHCFDMPFTLLCGSRETAQSVYAVLRPYSNSMKCQIQIAIEESK